jgi:hypothetical protein
MNVEGRRGKARARTNSFFAQIYRLLPLFITLNFDFAQGNDQIVRIDNTFSMARRASATAKQGAGGRIQLSKSSARPARGPSTLTARAARFCAEFFGEPLGRVGNDEKNFILS